MTALNGPAGQIVVGVDGIQRDQRAAVFSHVAEKNHRQRVGAWNMFCAQVKRRQRQDGLDLRAEGVAFSNHFVPVGIFLDDMHLAQKVMTQGGIHEEVAQPERVRDFRLFIGEQNSDPGGAGLGVFGEQGCQIGAFVRLGGDVPVFFQQGEGFLKGLVAESGLGGELNNPWKSCPDSPAACVDFLNENLMYLLSNRQPTVRNDRVPE